MAYRMRRQAPVFPRVVALLGVVAIVGGSVLMAVVPAANKKNSDKVLPKPTSGYSISATEAPEPSHEAEPSAKPTPKATTSPSPSVSPSSVRPSRRDDPSPRSTSSSPVKPTPKPTTAKPKPSPTPTPKPASPPAIDLRVNAEIRAQVIFLINQKRAQAGLAQLASNSDLSDKSQTWTVSLERRKVLEHSTPPPNKLWGEITASGYYTAESVVNAWMNSPGHRDNILRPEFKLIGSGYVNGYWTVQFG
jgi:uncharacterized protein YkwD